MTKVIRKVSGWNAIRNKKTFQQKTLGFVPTMGAFHKGHIALFEKSLKENDKTIVSIFINPAQFNNKADFQNYPKTYKADFEILKKLKVDYLFFPDYKAVYPDNYNFKVIETNFSKILCGKYREGHFDAVLTIVLKLLNIVKPNRVYFGEKDFQQLQLVRRMIKAFFLDIKLVAVPTIRNDDDLALSSRNLRLTSGELKTASLFPKLLKSNLSIDKIKERLNSNGFKVEYIEQFGNRRFGAVYIRDVRLIDNVKV